MVDPIAKDLITKLVVMNPKEELSALMILYREWVKGGGLDTLLNTPGNIRTIDFNNICGADRVSRFASSAMELNAIGNQHMGLSLECVLEENSDGDDLHTLFTSSPSQTEQHSQHERSMNTPSTLR